MENAAILMDKDKPTQKDPLTTNIKEQGANIHDEENKTAPITLEKNNPNDEAADSVEPSRSDAEDKNEEAKFADESRNSDHAEGQHNFEKSQETVEEGEIVLDVLLDRQSAIFMDTHPKTESALNACNEQSVDRLSCVEKIEPPKLLQETPLVDIDKRDDLERLIKELKNEKEIGVDVEWSDHGYEALVCLVQLSTKDSDYIIDAILLKDHMHLLQDIFGDPQIVKIFHAASNDLKWLQQDFNLFVVNMFDTQRAMRALGYTKLGLDFALQRYRVVKDKSMQRVDFRKRPLPPKYKDYARTDSHFLINMYQMLKNKLIGRNLLVQVLNECDKDCKVVHEKVDDGAYVSVRQAILKIHDRQLVALQKLNQWRHRVARYADLNTGVVLSKNNMKSLVLKSPVDEAGILQICKSAHVKDHLREIIDILAEAQGREVTGLKSKGSGFQKFSPQGGFSKKRRVDQTDFGDNSGQGPKRVKKFYGGDANKGRGKASNRQNDLFDLRNTLQSNPSRGNRGNRRGFRR